MHRKAPWVNKEIKPMTFLLSGSTAYLYTTVPPYQTMCFSGMDKTHGSLTFCTKEIKLIDIKNCLHLNSELQIVQHING